MVLKNYLRIVAQELLAYFGGEEENALFSWIRERKSSSAEIDFLVVIDRVIVPIEVKSTKLGSMRSLKLCKQEKQIPIGKRICENRFSFEESLLSLPFYGIEQLARFVRDVYTNG